MIDSQNQVSSLQMAQISTILADQFRNPRNHRSRKCCFFNSIMVLILDWFNNGLNWFEKWYEIIDSIMVWTGLKWFEKWFEIIESIKIKSIMVQILDWFRTSQKSSQFYYYECKLVFSQGLRWKAPLLSYTISTSRYILVLCLFWHLTKFN